MTLWLVYDGLTDLGPLHGHPLGAGKGVANLLGDRSRGVGALPLLHLGELSLCVLLYAQHAANLPPATLTAGHRALGPGALLPAVQTHTTRAKLT